MKIYFERTGGFTGLNLSVSIETDSLPPDDSAALQKIIADAGLFSLRDTESSSGFPDGFQYTFKLEQDGEFRTIRVDEGSLPDELRPLVNDLSIRARSHPPLT